MSQIPSIDRLRELHAATAGLLATYDQYRLVLDDPSPGFPGLCESVVPRNALRGYLYRLEKAFNPGRRPYDPGLAYSLCVVKWPPQVLTALPILHQVVYELVRRWDITEVCDDRLIVRQHAPPSHTLTDREWKRLGWVQQALAGALSPPAEGTEAVVPESGEPAPPDSQDRPPAGDPNPLDPEAVWRVLEALGVEPARRPADAPTEAASNSPATSDPPAATSNSPDPDIVRRAEEALSGESALLPADARTEAAAIPGTALEGVRGMLARSRAVNASSLVQTNTAGSNPTKSDPDPPAATSNLPFASVDPQALLPARKAMPPGQDVVRIGRLEIDRLTRRVSLGRKSEIIDHATAFQIFLFIAEAKGALVTSEGIREKVLHCNNKVRIDTILKNHLPAWVRKLIPGQTGPNGGYDLHLPE
jgi:hypothetical protein